MKRLLQIDNGKGDYFAKQDVTLWSYQDGGMTPSYIKGMSSVEVSYTYEYIMTNSF